MSRLQVEIQGLVKEVQAESGESVLEALQRGGIQIFAPCGGNGRCGNCKVTLVSSDQSRKEVLACTTLVTKDMKIEIPDQSAGVIVTESSAKEQSEVVVRDGFGIAVDLGTTTVALSLHNLSTGEVISATGAWNAQASYGADVVSRTQYVIDHSDGLYTLGSCIRTQIYELAKVLCHAHHVDLNQLKEAVIAGNTIMQHIAAGIDPRAIVKAPYIPDTYFLNQESMQFDELPGIKVRFAPCIAGYVGGDIAAGLLSCNAMERDGLQLFLDIGTNGEMVLMEDNSMISCSVASGPAFEGAEISCGMPSGEGAISHVTYENGQIHFQVIGDGKPTGICGSGLIDLLAVLLDLEIVDESGYLLPPDEVDAPFSEMMKEDDRGNGIFYLTDEVYLTAADVRKLQLAKAAVAAGIEVLLNETGKEAAQIDQLILAGGFGRHMDAENAAKIGMIPEMLSERTHCVGNSSLAGAETLLQNPKLWDMIYDIQQKCRYLELSGNNAFTEAYVDHMEF